MLKRVAATLLFLVIAATMAMTATKDSEKPDPEMLKMMEFLREMEVIKQIDLLQDMHRVEAASDQTRAAPRKTEPVKQKETVK
ncbi:MAG: hypothetical protein ACREQO_19870 [Candidatus Binatia bacterium]